MVLLKSFKSRKPRHMSDADIDMWERRYRVGAIFTLGGFGILAGLCAMFYPDSTLSFATFATALGACLSVGTRNNASAKVVRSAVAACCIPAVVAYFVSGYVHGSHRSYVLGVLMIFVFAMSIYLGDYIRRQLIEALLKGRLNEMSSRRFDAAISSMPNGLMMVGSDGNILVVNATAERMLGADRAVSSGLDAHLARVFSPENVLEISKGLRQAMERKVGSHCISTQLATKDGRWMQLEFSPLADHPASETDDHEAVGDGAVVMILQDVTERVAGLAALRQAASYDKLSGLANRTHWEALVDRAVDDVASDGYVALCILDVDRFKLINDTLGHKVGDEVISGVGSRLRSIEDSRIIAGRLGGDEFVVVFTDIDGQREAVSLFDMVMARISGMYAVSGHNIDVRCSGGVIVRRQAEFDRQSDMNRADMALYKVKKGRLKAWMLFDGTLENEYLATSKIKNDLKKAIEDGDLQVVYQPIFDVDGKYMVSTEALCRWIHPEIGRISPAVFVGMAEEIGVIGKLTEYVLRTACRDCAAWGADVPVSVNLSALDLARDDILGMIRTALQDFGLSATRLCIEVTETVFVKDFSKTAATLRTLNDMGVKTSLDDFGTGYSSLSYLSSLPLNRVKIDQSFIADIDSDSKARRLFRGVVSLANELEFEVIVEGVERADQLSFVRNVPGIDMIQGHIFSQPYTAADMAEGHAVRLAMNHRPR